jgi:2'-5' RNA ligase
MKDKIRTFIAIEIDSPTREYLHKQQKAASLILPHVRFVDPATWHITLAFIGEINANQLEKTLEVTNKSIKGIPPFTLHATHIGIFGPTKAPRVIWVGIDGMMQPLIQLNQLLISQLQDAEIPCEVGRFSPHITLARPKVELNQSELEQFQNHIDSEDQGPDMLVQSISIMRSELLQHGAKYTCMHKVVLIP